jgi:hypothetical protein
MPQTLDCSLFIMITQSHLLRVATTSRMVAVHGVNSIYYRLYGQMLQRITTAYNLDGNVYLSSDYGATFTSNTAGNYSYFLVDFNPSGTMAYLISHGNVPVPFCKGLCQGVSPPTMAPISDVPTHRTFHHVTVSSAH